MGVDAQQAGRYRSIDRSLTQVLSPTYLPTFDDEEEPVHHPAGRVGDPEQTYKMDRSMGRSVRRVSSWGGHR